jgi:single-strand DNA-binding protein
MNRVILIGRLTRDPEIRYSKDEKAQTVARYTLAVDRRFKREQEAGADFIGCVAFGRNAEFAEKYLKQGIKIAIEGRIQTGNYTKPDGTRVYTTDVVIESQEFVESKQAGNHGTSAGNGEKQTKNQSEPAGEEFMSIPEGVDEDLPFE